MKLQHLGGSIVNDYDILMMHVTVVIDLFAPELTYRALYLYLKINKLKCFIIGFEQLSIFSNSYMASRATAPLQYLEDRSSFLVYS